MKSDALELLKTSCKDCIFADYENNTQTGCKAYRLDFFKQKDKVLEAYDYEKEFFVVTGLCNFYRTKNWNDGSSDFELAKKELAPTFDIIINCNDLCLEKQKKLIDSLNSINYYEKKIGLTLFYDIKQPKEVRSLCLEILAIFQPRYNTTVSVCIDVNEHMNLYLHDKLLSSYFLYFDSNSDVFEASIFNVIQEDINILGKKILLFQHKNLNILSSIAYRAYVLRNQDQLDFANNIQNTINLCKEQKLFTEI